MRHTILIMPGFHGSGPDHWQTWLESELPGCHRVSGVDWEAPVLARWAGEVRREIDAAPHPVWLVAHSFGCLAGVVAIADRPEKVAGALLVAPADPERFSPLGLRDAGGASTDSVAPWLPRAHLGCPSVVVASSNDPWVKPKVAARLAELWGSRFIDLGPAGHINAEAGFGPWPWGMDLLRAMQQAQADLPLGAIDNARPAQKGRHGALARIRHRTRFTLGFRPGES